MQRLTRCLLGLCALASPASLPTIAAAQAPADGSALMDALVRAYPAALAGHDGAAIVWKDGARTPLDDGKGTKSLDLLFSDPDLKDMFHWPYPRGAMQAPPGRDVDPGRIRNAGFFARLYGDCRKGEVADALVDVVWLPGHWGKSVKFNRRNGASEALGRVSMVLDRLPARELAFLRPVGGTYNCRPIAGTTQLSAHGFGIAIDINTRFSHYWRWARPEPDGSYRYRNSIPRRIVEIFERHGFIWGGRWYHFDTMHFEYRPELLIQP